MSTELRKNNWDINISNFIIKDGFIFKIPKLDFYHFSEWYFNTQKKEYYIQIKYNSLMRFYLYHKFLKYDGDDEDILEYQAALKNGDDKKITIINKLPNNNIVMKLIVDKFDLDIPIRNSYSDVKKLKKFIENYKEIFSDENLVYYISKVEGSSKRSKHSEKVVKGLLNLLYGKRNIVTNPTSNEDISGIDSWLLNKESGDRKPIQVKDISESSKLVIEDNIVTINNSSIDLHNYRINHNAELPYDYLVFFIEKEKKACIIKSTAIFSINRYNKQIKIKINDWAMDSKFKDFVFRYVDIPKKLLPPDTSNIWY